MRTVLSSPGCGSESAQAATETARSLRRVLCMTRDLLYPIAVVNGLAQNGLRRCPRLRLRTTETEDLTTFAAALPGLVNLGMKVDRQWAQERIGVPEPEDGAEILGAAPAANTSAPGDQPASTPQPKVAALAQQIAAPGDAAPDPAAQMVGRLDGRIASASSDWIGSIRDLVASAKSLEEIRDGLQTVLPDLTLDQYAEAMAQALAAAALAGRYEILQEAARG